MIPLGHVGGVPVEEFLTTLGGPAAGLVVVRTWLSVRLRRERDKHR